MRNISFRRHKRLILGILAFVAFIAAPLVYFHRHPIFVEKLLWTKEAEEVAALTYIATALIAIIAYFQLSESNRISKNNFLLSIAEKWGSDSIIRARKVLNKLFVRSYRGKSISECKKCHFINSLKEVSDGVFKMKNLSGAKGDDFVHLIDLLDFMELIGFYADKNYIDPNEIDDIFGNSILFYFASFDRFIKNRQNYDSQYYVNFCNLAKFLKKNNGNYLCAIHGKGIFYQVAE